MALWCLFDFIIREIGNINIVIGYSISKTTSKRLNEKKVLFDYLDRI